MTYLELFVAFLETPWGMVLNVLVGLSGAWYFIKIGKRFNKTRNGRRAVKEIFVGQPVVLAVILIGVVAIVYVASAFGLPVA